MVDVLRFRWRPNSSQHSPALPKHALPNRALSSGALASVMQTGRSKSCCIQTEGPSTTLADGSRHSPLAKFWKPRRRLSAAASFKARSRGHRRRGRRTGSAAATLEGSIGKRGKGGIFVCSFLLILVLIKSMKDIAWVVLRALGLLENVRWAGPCTQRRLVHVHGRGTYLYVETPQPKDPRATARARLGMPFIRCNRPGLWRASLPPRLTPLSRSRGYYTTAGEA